jgi:hypothetical protein
MMAIMMMNQALDRDKRQEEREERCQYFHLQVEMQCQQMQAQENTMAMLMMTMMGQSASVPNEGIANILPGWRNQQRNGP